MPRIAITNMRGIGGSLLIQNSPLLEASSIPVIGKTKVHNFAGKLSPAVSDWPLGREF
jgi:hypothetical protein